MSKLKTQPNAATSENEPLEQAPDYTGDGAPADLRADLEPVIPPAFYAATDDPEHPLHYHSKPITGPSPEVTD